MSPFTKGFLIGAAVATAVVYLLGKTYIAGAQAIAGDQTGL